jgi:PD-(D/E)XK nuclease superfamily/LAGLIDADG-like domain
MALAHSYSSVKAFDNCPRQYHQVRILKKFKQSESEAMLYGTAVHTAMEEFLMKGTPLPEQFSQFQPFADAVNKSKGTRLCEIKLGIKADFTPCDFYDKDVWFRGLPDVLVIDGDLARVGDWKGLALDTKIPTPFGWSTMGGLQVGDLVFDSRGETTTVVGKSKVKHIPCYKVTFSDNTAVVCDEEHLWKLVDGSAINVKELMGTRNNRQRTYIPKVPTAAPLALSDVELPVDPYVLGLWLADGSLASNAISKPDTFVWEEVQRRGYGVNMNSGGSGACPTRTVKGLRKGLRELGLLGVHKRIPAEYQRAGYQQRLDLLRGLMDGDGNANPTRKQAVFTSTSKALSDDVMELLCGLGQRPLQNTVKTQGFGKTGIAYPIAFRPICINPFLLPRKADRILPGWGPGKATYRYALSVELVPTVATQCIAVSSPDHTFLCTERMIPTHNTGRSSRYADPDQLELMAAMTMAHYPEVQRVKAALIFLVAKDTIKAEYTRSQFAAIMSKWAGRASRIEAALESGVWNPRKGPLCRFCPVDTATCEFKE